MSINELYIRDFSYEKWMERTITMRSYLGMTADKEYLEEIRNTLESDDKNSFRPNLTMFANVDIDDLESMDALLEKFVETAKVECTGTPLSPMMKDYLKTIAALATKYDLVFNFADRVEFYRGVLKETCFRLSRLEEEINEYHCKFKNTEFMDSSSDYYLIDTDDDKALFTDLVDRIRTCAKRTTKIKGKLTLWLRDNLIYPNEKVQKDFLARFNRVYSIMDSITVYSCYLGYLCTCKFLLTNDESNIDKMLQTPSGVFSEDPYWYEKLFDYLYDHVLVFNCLDQNPFTKPYNVRTWYKHWGTEETCDSEIIRRVIKLSDNFLDELSAGMDLLHIPEEEPSVSIELLQEQYDYIGAIPTILEDEIGDTIPLLYKVCCELLPPALESLLETAKEIPEINDVAWKQIISDLGNLQRNKFLSFTSFEYDASTLKCSWHDAPLFCSCPTEFAPVALNLVERFINVEDKKVFQDLLDEEVSHTVCYFLSSLNELKRMEDDDYGDK
jgi:hypothetical protein